MILRKRRNMTPEGRYRRALRGVISGALLTGYLVGWTWRGKVGR